MGPRIDNRRLTPLDDEQLRHVLEFLIVLREKSDPVHGETSETLKHYNAQQAIFFTGLLVESLCAWAFDHFTGTVKEGPVKGAAFGEADDHRFEMSGRSYKPGNPSIDRKILAHLISMGGVIPFALRQPFARALQALGAGETVDLVRPAPTGMWRSPYSLAELRLDAMNHVFFRWGGGITKKEAREEVAACLGVSPPTLRSWETTWLRKTMGPNVANIFATAKRAGALRRWLEENPGQSSKDHAAHALLMQLNNTPIEEIADAHRRLQKQVTSKR
jgi:hypothetical protein